MPNITIENRVIPYEIRTSKRAKRVGLTVYCDGRVVVTVPQRARAVTVEKFLQEKQTWLVKTVTSFARVKDPKVVKVRKSDYRKHKDVVLALVTARLEFFNLHYNYAYNKVAVRNQKTQWGSCSATGSISLNYKLFFLTEEMRDYVIVHELCHLKEMNHSPRFWALVEQTIPNHKEIRRQFKSWYFDES